MRSFGPKRALWNHVDDNHTGTHYCKFCPKNFTKKCNLRRRTLQMHKIIDGLPVCSFCGKVMWGKDYLKNQEKKCNGRTMGKNVNKEKSLDCELCEVKFSSGKGLRYHKNIKHTVEMNGCIELLDIWSHITYVLWENKYVLRNMNYLFQFAIFWYCYEISLYPRLR